MFIDEQVQGRIIFTDGTEYPFTSEDIIDDDISILQQATADNSFSVGGAYASTLSMNIRIPMGYTNSYDIIGSKITIFSKRCNENTFTNEGIFWVTSASRYKDIYTISGSDAITWLDTIPYLDQTLYDNNNEPYNNEVYHAMMSYVGSLTDKLNDILSVVNNYLNEKNINGVTLHSYNQSVINNINQGGFCVLPSSLTGENATHCPRDYASWLSQIACGFIQCFYDTTETSYVGFGSFETSFSETLEWSNFEKDTFEIAGFIIDFNKIYAEIYNGVINSTGNSSSSNLNSIDLDLSGNAILDGHYQYSSNIDDDAYRTSVPLLTSILNHLNNVNIRPFSGTYHGEKRFKLGQCIKIIDENQVEYLTTLTKIQWNFRGGYQLKCSGEDNRILFDSARRTPSKKAKEEALTKTNYAIKKSETGLQSNLDSAISYVDNKFEVQIGSVAGDTADLSNAVVTLWNSMYAENDTVDSLRKRIETLEGKINTTS